METIDCTFFQIGEIEYEKSSEPSTVPTGDAPPPEAAHTAVATGGAGGDSMTGETTPQAAAPGAEPINPQPSAATSATAAAAPKAVALAAAPDPANAPRVYLLDNATNKEIARLDLPGTTAAELPKVLVWGAAAFIRDGTTRVYRSASVHFIEWGEKRQ